MLHALGLWSCTEFAQQGNRARGRRGAATVVAARISRRRSASPSASAAAEQRTERCEPPLVFRVHLRTVLRQELNDRVIAHRRSAVQRRVARLESPR